MPFLSVITRCYKRPKMFRQNVLSLAAQTDQDFEQIFIVDKIGYGIGGANRALATVEPTGDYVLVLDDDDIISEPRAIECLKEATTENPDIVIFKGDFHNLGVLPDEVVWGKRPLLGHIGSCSFVVSNDVWKKHVAAWGSSGDDCGDYEFLKELWQGKPQVVWLDKLLVAIPTGRSFGTPGL